jgi:hypothetical protein
MNAFIDVAVKHGVRRFVMLAGSGCELGGGARAAGKVWQYLVDQKLEYCVLRATWVMVMIFPYDLQNSVDARTENFSQWQHVGSIKNEGKIYTARDNGKYSFVSPGDIAAVAFRVLEDGKSHDTSYRVLGPELLTHDEVCLPSCSFLDRVIVASADSITQVATKLSNFLGRKIENVKLSGEENEKRWLSLGVPTHVAGFMVRIEVATSKGAEERENHDVEILTGKVPQSFGNWVQENKAVWQ